MSVTAILVWIVVGAIAGWLAGQIVRGAGFGLVGNIIVGIIGAAVAGYLLPRIGLVFSIGGPIVTQILYAAIGGIVVLLVLSLIRRAT